MADYKVMYSILCGAMSDALDELDTEYHRQKAVFILQRALEKTEEMYIEADCDKKQH